MTIHPKRQRDLMLAPVAAQIDLNLQRLRDMTARQVEAELELELDRPATNIDREERELLVLLQALRNVNLHGWDPTISGDGCRLHLSGGSVTIDVGLSSGIAAYIRDGVSRREAAAVAGTAVGALRSAI